MRRLEVLLGLVASAAVPRAGAAQSPVRQPAEPVFSMGQPRQWLPYASGVAVANPFGVNGTLGIAHPVLNPVTGLLGANGEAYGQWRGDRADGGIRALATIPAFGFGAGADWRATNSRVDAILSFQTALRRGGLLGHGTTLRMDFLPTRSEEFHIGVSVPLAQPFAGRTRPFATTARVPIQTAPSTRAAAPTALPTDAVHSLDAVARAGALISAYTMVDPTADGSLLASTSMSYDDAMRSYGESLAAAFDAAVADPHLAGRVAARARGIVFDRTILPYDALFGQAKDNGAMDDLLAASRSWFAKWLADSSGVPAAAQPATRAVYDHWTNILTDLSHQLLHRWRDSRLVWIPAQFALAPDQFDHQAEIDTLVGRAVGHPFTDNNEVAYLRTADLPLEIARSIMAARRYHVLCTHDFTGRRLSGRLDEISYTMVADAYIPALTAAVQRYDTSGVMPQYFMLLDAFYYHGRFGRMWMNVLEHPLTAGLPLRANEAQETDHLRERLDALKRAVASSKRLQREAAAQGGTAWLDRVVKVNVNIVLPSDFTFRSSHTAPPLPFTPDNIVRDHRKLVLYDFTEDDPSAGELLVTGIGIGEHYASATWEDRGYRLRGPAALAARVALRETLESNGFRPDQIPEPLRVIDPPPRAHPRAGVARVLHVQNEPGFGAKHASVARAMLYTLAPPGSDIIVPDPLWLSESWSGMLLAAAARGCRIVIITPAVANSPNPEPTVIALQHEVLRDMLDTRHRLASRIQTAGGAFHIGIYAAHAPVTDVRARFAEVRAGLARSPWIREMIPFDSTAIVALNNATMEADRTSAGAILAEDEKPREPQLHQKTQLIARPGAIAALVRQPGWERTLARTLIAQSQETARLAEAIAAPVPATDTAAVRAADQLLQSYERSLTADERTRLSFYFTLGSQNHDMRGLMMDGESNVVVSGFDASAGLVDLFYLMARTTWVDSPADIDRLVPARSGLVSRLAHLIRLTM
jgi:phosphatidylserine/phosphatidylglycerophosphate/cardiolipin synthase-like enzyme